MAERFCDIIQKKKDGKILSEEEIKEMISDYCEEKIPDYQMAAMLMAICFQGMTDEELATMTLAMTNSGNRVDLSSIQGVKVDKHSTGGVGDKTTLIIGPIVAAAGVPVAKMSGRGLGFTGGTIDKLESIPGFCTEISVEQFSSQVNEIGICVAGQSGELAPADKKLYALRDVTATVESIPLIAASVMSKKIAAGSDKILLDVTTGSGAFIKDIDGAKELAEKMVAIGTHNGKETVALITDMDEPLGLAIGNNLEVKEAIEALHGRGPNDLMEVCYALAGNMIFLAGEGKYTYEEALQMAADKVKDGSAWEKFCYMVKSQGGELSYVEKPETFKKAKISEEVTAPVSGYLKHMVTAEIGVAAGMLGAGRATKDSRIDNSAGIILKKKPGDKVEKGEVIATLFAETKEQTNAAKEHFLANCEFGEKPPVKRPLILGRITKDTSNLYGNEV